MGRSSPPFPPPHAPALCSVTTTGSTARRCRVSWWPVLLGLGLEEQTRTSSRNRYLHQAPHCTAPHSSLPVGLSLCSWPLASRPEHARLPLPQSSLGSGWASQGCAETGREAFSAFSEPTGHLAPRGTRCSCPFPGAFSRGLCESVPRVCLPWSCSPTVRSSSAQPSSFPSPRMKELNGDPRARWLKRLQIPILGKQRESNVY